MTKIDRRAAGKLLLILVLSLILIVCTSTNVYADSVPVATPLIATMKPGFEPHKLNTSYYTDLKNYTLQKNLTYTVNNITNIVGVFKGEYTDYMGESQFWMIVYGMPALLLFWRSMSPFLPSMALLIMSPIIWPYVSGEWRMAIVACVTLAIVGVVYSFFISIKRQ